MHVSKFNLPAWKTWGAPAPWSGFATVGLTGAERKLIIAALSRKHPYARLDTDTAARVLDIVLATLIITFLLPVLVLIGVTIAVLDPGPIFFAHRRIGRHGHPFDCYKFRTMRVDAESALAKLLAEAPELRKEWALHQKLVRDPRVTGFGHLLRNSCLDELPQLFNVLLGDMSLVGPRPVVASELSHYRGHAASYLSVRPGLTGLWQVSRKCDTTYRRRVAADVLYVRRKSMALDWRILIATIPAVLRGEGCC